MFDINNLVSIIVPIYNAEKYLDRCINSVLAQTYDAYELLLINDGSKDNSLNICKENAKRDLRIIVLDKQNGGVSSARNLGLDIAKGEFILFLDADDDIDSFMLEKMVGHMTSSISLVMCGYKQITDNNYTRELALVPRDEKINDKTELFKILEKNWAPWGKLYRRNLINQIRFDENLAIAEDLKFNIDILCDNDSFDSMIISDSLYNYVINNDSSMNQRYSYKVLDALCAEEIVLNKLLSCGIRENAINKILIGGVLYFYDRYSRLDLRERRENKKDYRVAREIINRNKSYILEKENKTIKEKFLTYIICYFPCIGIYLMKMVRNLKILKK